MTVSSPLQLIDSLVDISPQRAALFGLVILKHRQFLLPGASEYQIFAHPHVEADDLEAQCLDAIETVETTHPAIPTNLASRLAAANVADPIWRDLIRLVDRIEPPPTALDRLGHTYAAALHRSDHIDTTGGSTFYTPLSVGQLLLLLLNPEPGSAIYDPCVGSGRLLINAAMWVDDDSTSLFGQERSPLQWCLTQLNASIWDIDLDLGGQPGDTLRDDRHTDRQADYVLANPPFNADGWGRDDLYDDPRWQWGLPPAHDGTFAWLQHILHHLGTNGAAGIVMPDETAADPHPQQKAIRRVMLRDGVVDCVIALPSDLFTGTQLAPSLWIVSTDPDPSPDGCLLIDARTQGKSTSLKAADLSRIATAYHLWREGHPAYQDTSGWCRSVGVDAVADQSWSLHPGHHAGHGRGRETPAQEQRMEHLTDRLADQLEATRRLEEEVREQMQNLGYEL